MKRKASFPFAFHSTLRNFAGKDYYNEESEDYLTSYINHHHPNDEQLYHRNGRWQFLYG